MLGGARRSGAWTSVRTPPIIDSRIISPTHGAGDERSEPSMSDAIALFKDGLDLVLTSSSEGASEVSLDVRPSHMNAVGVLHGGAVFTLVDTGMACALMSQL